MDMEEEYEHEDERSQYIQGKAQSLIRLAMSMETRGTSLKREDIIKYVLQENHKDFKKVFEKAQKLLDAILGMELIELEPKESLVKDYVDTKKIKKQAEQKAKSSYLYILRNKLTLEERGENPIETLSELEMRKDGLTMIVLCLIFVHQNILSHSTLVNNLLGYEEITYKEIDELINSLMKQKFIIRHKVITQDNAPTQNERNITQEDYINKNYQYQWGSKAKAVVSFDTIKSFMEDIYGDADKPANLDDQLETLYKNI